MHEDKGETKEYWLIPYAHDKRRKTRDEDYEKVYNLTDHEAKKMNYAYGLNGVHQRLVRTDARNLNKDVS
tara:strand:+ start:382 stop:591 length:210 start_codon:yes stop_codon:yes gene_type:complete